jgi:hypothetical protein
VVLSRTAFASSADALLAIEIRPSPNIRPGSTRLVATTSNAVAKGRTRPSAYRVIIRS